MWFLYNFQRSPMHPFFQYNCNCFNVYQINHFIHYFQKYFVALKTWPFVAWKIVIFDWAVIISAPRRAPIVNYSFTNVHVRIPLLKYFNIVSVKHNRMVLLFAVCSLIWNSFFCDSKIADKYCQLYKDISS